MWRERACRGLHAAGDFRPRLYALFARLSLSGRTDCLCSYSFTWWAVVSRSIPQTVRSNFMIFHFLAFSSCFGNSSSTSTPRVPYFRSLLYETFHYKHTYLHFVVILGQLCSCLVLVNVTRTCQDLQHLTRCRTLFIFKCGTSLKCVIYIFPARILK